MTSHNVSKTLRFFFMVFVCLVSVQAQITLDELGSVLVTNKFGTPFVEPDPLYYEYLGLHASVHYTQGSIRDFVEGDILFIQGDSALPGWFPHTGSDFIAITGKEGYVHLFSGHNLSNEADVRGEIEFKYSIFDRSRKAWVNPVFFIRGINDTHGPQISALVLERAGVEYDFKDSNLKKITYPQGNYSLLTSITDDNPKQSSSGLIRIKVVLDGISIIDNKLDIASAGMEGLSFLGYQAPSSIALGRKSRLKIGELQLLRGEHSLELFAYDFAGNESLVRWKLRVD